MQTLISLLQHYRGRGRTGGHPQPPSGEYPCTPSQGKKGELGDTPSPVRGVPLHPLLAKSELKTKIPSPNRDERFNLTWFHPHSTLDS